MTQEVWTAPEPDDATQEWWDATRARRLMVQRCTACSSHQHPPRAVCIACGRMSDLELVEAAGQATVDSWTEVYRSPNPTATVPYTIARVRLAEGPVMLTRLIDSDGWRIGDPVEVEWVELEDGRALPVFRRESP